MLKSLIYVSRSRLADLNREAELDAIMVVSRARNKSLDVTGALISSSMTFAQFLEGPRTAIEALMNSITRDPRHKGVRVVSFRDEADRQFSNWSMAYAGHSSYVDRITENLLNATAAESNRARLESLESLIREFSRTLH